MRAIVLFVLLAVLWTGAQAQPPAPVYVTLWFDTEDYVLPESDDAAKRLAETLTRLGVRATFKVVGEKARVLETRGRGDVIAALGKHEIGYHSNTHSMQPTIAVYLQHAGWEDGAAEFQRREVSGVRDIERIFGVTPICYGQPGAAWAPQTYPALKQMGIGMYLDESDHVGIDEQPFYYGGMLNVTRMRSNVVRMELKGGESLAEGKAKFTAALRRLQSRGGGTISIYYHPCEWVHTEFWDGVNFSRGANPPRSEWRLPRTRPAVETEKAFADFEQYVRFIQAQPDARFVTAADLMKLYEDRATARAFSAVEVLKLAESARVEIGFQRREDYSLSGADLFSILNEAMTEYVERSALPATVRPKLLFGPARGFVPPAGGVRPASLPWPAFAASVREVAVICRATGRLPSEIWIGVDSLSPQDYLATLAGAIETVAASKAPPSHVTVREGRFTADRFVAEDSPRLWGWVIFPEGFHAPKIMEHARLQAWTLKPAILSKSK
ncbi:MAG: polysaccharide deacetylase family protein [Blastocatellia bacterium]